MGISAFGRQVSIGIAAAGLSVLLPGGCVDNSKSGGDTGIRAAQQQKAFKDAAVIHQALQAAVATDANLSEYFQLVGTRLLDGAKQSGASVPADIHFVLVSSPVHNVIVPGGQWIYITTGLLQQCGSEDDTASALAHGLAHLLDHHIQRKGVGDSSDAVVLTLAMTSASVLPSEEAQADRDGLQYFAHAGWKPEKYADIMVRSGNRDGTRIQDIRQQAAQLAGQARAWSKPLVADDRTFAQLLQHMGSIRQAPDEKAAQILAAFPGCFSNSDEVQQADARKRLMEMLPQIDPHVHHGLGASGSGTVSNP